MHKDMRQPVLQSIFFALIIILNLVVNVSYALPFSIATKEGTTLPTTVHQGSTVSAFYTVTNSTASTRSNNYVKYLPPNTTQTTSGIGVCSSLFTLAAKGQPGDSCTLALQISGEIKANDPERSHHLFVCFPGGKTCAGSTDQLNVQLIEAKRLISLLIAPSNASIDIGQTQQYTATGTYSDSSTETLTTSVAWNSSAPNVATIDSNGQATAVGQGTSNITASLAGVTSNVATLTADFALVSITISPTTANLRPGDTQQFTATGTYADSSTRDITSTVTWNSSNPASTSIAAGGLATSLVAGTSNITASLNSITSNTAVVTTRSFLYSGSAGISNGIDFTALLAGGAPGVFAPTGPTSTPSAVVLNPNADRFYWTDNSNPVRVFFANVDTTTGVIANSTTATGSIFSTARGLAITSDDAFIYVTDGTTVKYCQLTAGVLSNCQNAITGLGTLLRIVLTPDNSTAYVSTLTNFYYCPINSDQTFNSCTLQSPSFSSISQLAVHPAGTYFYVAANGGVRVCPIAEDGSVPTCSSAGGPGVSSGLTLNYNGTLAYIMQSGSAIITTCQINNNGTFSNCTDSAAASNATSLTMH